ncbi:MAG TPA: hypothetical protein VKP69_10055, partial [Isosphaeraceae bacterium]|nr:hypothetical protein [Isosphaeraceae bacterium]
MGVALGRTGQVRDELLREDQLDRARRTGQIRVGLEADGELVRLAGLPGSVPGPGHLDQVGGGGDLDEEALLVEHLLVPLIDDPDRERP